MNKELVIGTSNPAKIDMVRAALTSLEIEVFDPADLAVLLDVEEDGTTAAENARKKSRAYAAALDKPILSMDIALYIDGLSDAEQPGIHTRRVPEIEGRMSDAEMLAHYAALFDRLGGEVNGHWDMAVCLIDRAGAIFETNLISHRRFTSVPSKKILPGFPLASLQIEPTTGKYIAEMNEAEQNALWQRVLGKDLMTFVAEALRL